jgi:hypothetical protein
METLDLCRGIDLTGMTGDVFVAVDVGETDADDGAAAESFSIDVCDGAPDGACGCAAGWQPAVGHTGDLDGSAVFSVRHLVSYEALGGIVGTTIGVRVTATAGGPGDAVEIDRIGVGSIDYACPSAELTVGSISDIGGGGYAVDLGSTAATTAQMTCSWNTTFPPVDDRSSVEFLP